MTHPSLRDLLDEGTWLEYRETALKPQVVSDLVTTEHTRMEFALGAGYLRLGTRGRPVLPQQLIVADMLNAGRRRNGILLPRRGTKTTSIQAVLLGRCARREEYRVAWCLATTGVKTSARFREDVSLPVQRTYPDPRKRPFKLNLGKGNEYIEWPHGSSFSIHPPQGDAFRSGGYDVVWVDEAGEADIDTGEDLIGAIGPTLDTKPQGQMVFSGTAADFQDGNLLWDTLHRDGAGVLEYRFPDEVTDDELAAWEPSEDHPRARVRELIELTHPGVHAGLTPLQAVRDNFDDMKPERFAREYGGLFGIAGIGRGVFDQGHWNEAAQDGTPVVPERFTVAAACAFNQGSASIVAAWRDAEGRACIYVLDHHRGTTWVSDSAANIARDHKTPIIYDGASSPMRIEVEAMGRMNPRPRLVVQTTANITNAAALLVREVNTGNAQHWRQRSLEEGVTLAVRRSVGASAWALGRPSGMSDLDLSALEAGAMALRYYDEHPTREPFRPLVYAA